MVNTATGLRIAITASGLADKQVAERAKIHPSRLSRLLHGRETLTPAAQRRILQAIYPEALQEAGDDRPAA